MAQTVFVPLAEGFEEIEAIASVDILRRAGLDVTTVGLASRTVTGSHGIIVTADNIWDDIAECTPDALVLPGGMPGSKNLGQHTGLKAMAQRSASAGNWLAAICAAPAFTLAAWGLLGGRKATCFPGCEEEFFQDVLYVPDGVVKDGRFITASGPGMAFPFALTVVENMLDPETAARLKLQLQYR